MTQNALNLSTPASRNQKALPQIGIREGTVALSWPGGLTLCFGTRALPENGEALLGLAEASVHEVPLIAPGSLRKPSLETRNGWLTVEYRLLEVRPSSDDGVTLECEVWATKPPLGRRTDAFGFPYLAAPQERPERIGRLSWRLWPEQRSIGHPDVRETAYTGFSYSYDFSLKYPFHWVLDLGTWELGGEAEGITLFSQHMAAIGGPMEFQISRNGSPYTSAETFPKHQSNGADVFQDTANDPGERYVIPIQAQLRGAGGALVDFQYRGDSALVCFYEKPDYYRTLIEYLPVESLGIAHLDAHYFPKTTRHQTPAKTLLLARRPGLSRVEALNLWTDAHEFVGTSWREQVGVKRVEPRPGFGVGTSGAAGTHIGFGPADLLDRWKQRLDWLQARGFKTFFVGNLGDHRGFEFPYIANVCQPYDYRPHAFYGGPEAFRAFCAEAKKREIGVIYWIGMPCADAPILKKHPEWRIRHDNGARWDGNYITINSAAYNRGYGDWLLNELRTLRNLGLGGVFIDSYHNLWGMPIDYGQPDLRPQFPDLLKLQREIEQLGLECWTESFSAVGLTAAGLWPQYLQAPELTYWTHFRTTANTDRPGLKNAFRNGTVTLPIYWRLLANKSPLGISVVDFSDTPFEGWPDIPEELTSMNHAYNTLSPAMQIRTLQEDGSIAWHDPANARGALFGTGTGLTVPAGYRAIPVYGATEMLAEGSYPCVQLTAYHLETAVKR